MNFALTSIMRSTVVALLITGLSTSALAGDLAATIAKAAQQQAVQQHAAQSPSAAEVSRPIPGKYLWPGLAMLAGGLATGLYFFMNNENGQFPGANEYEATNKKAGGVALATAFAGGAVLFLGSKQSRKAAMVTVAPAGITVSNRLSW